jgi:hypothetical protein
MQARLAAAGWPFSLLMVSFASSQLATGVSTASPVTGLGAGAAHSADCDVVVGLAHQRGLGRKQMAPVRISMLCIFCMPSSGHLQAVTICRLAKVR